MQAQTLLSDTVTYLMAEPDVQKEVRTGILGIIHHKQETRGNVQIQARVKVGEVQRSQRQTGSNTGISRIRFRNTGTAADQTAKY